MSNRAIRQNYSHAIEDKNKGKRRIEASRRQFLRSKRSNEEQIAKLDAEGWNAKKERARL